MVEAERGVQKASGRRASQTATEADGKASRCFPYNPPPPQVSPDEPSTTPSGDDKLLAAAGHFHEEPSRRFRDPRGRKG